VLIHYWAFAMSSTNTRLGDFLSWGASQAAVVNALLGNVALALYVCFKTSLYFFSAQLPSAAGLPFAATGGLPAAFHDGPGGWAACHHHWYVGHM